MTIEFGLSYQGYEPGKGCTGQRSLKGFAPDDPGDGSRCPILLYLHGTMGEWSLAQEWDAITHAAAELGFVAGAPVYNSLWTLSLSGVQQHAQCIFPAAVQALEESQRGDRGKGVAVVGFSQGAGIAAFAKDHCEEVRALWLLACSGPVIPEAIVPPRKIANQDVRITVGQGQVGTSYDDLDALTGSPSSRGTGEPHNHLSADGSGYYVVQDGQAEDGNADHCFFINDQCWGTELDGGWLNGGDPWELGPCLQWLRDRCDP